jgi:hypothetical protein
MHVGCYACPLGACGQRTHVHLSCVVIACMYVGCAGHFLVVDCVRLGASGRAFPRMCLNFAHILLFHGGCRYLLCSCSRFLSIVYFHLVGLAGVLGLWGGVWLSP